MLLVEDDDTVTVLLVPTTPSAFANNMQYAITQTIKKLFSFYRLFKLLNNSDAKIIIYVSSTKKFS